MVYHDAHLEQALDLVLTGRCCVYQNWKALSLSEAILNKSNIAVILNLLNWNSALYIYYLCTEPATMCGRIGGLRQTSKRLIDHLL